MTAARLVPQIGDVFAGAVVERKDEDVRMVGDLENQGLAEIDPRRHFQRLRKLHVAGRFARRRGDGDQFAADRLVAAGDDENVFAGDDRAGVERLADVASPTDAARRLFQPQYQF